MKISKSQLKQIIKEELLEVSSFEPGDPTQGPGEMSFPGRVQARRSTLEPAGAISGEEKSIDTGDPNFRDVLRDVVGEIFREDLNLQRNLAKIFYELHAAEMAKRGSPLMPVSPHAETAGAPVTASSRVTQGTPPPAATLREPRRRLTKQER